VVIWLERCADLHMAQLMPLPLTVSCFSKIQIGFTFLVPAPLGSPGQRAVKRVSVCVCVCVCVCVRQVAKTQLPRDRLYQRIALSPWGNYSFRVLAQNAAGVSEPSASTRDVCTTAPDVPHINPRGVCTRNVRPRTLVITWQVNPSLRSRAPSAALMPTEARGNYLPERPYLRDTKTYHSHQPLESIRHAGYYFVPISIRPIFIFCCRSYVNLLDY